MRHSDQELIASLGKVSRHGCLRRLAHRRGNRYLLWAIGYDARRSVAQQAS